MKPASFNYCVPSTVEEAVQAVGQAEDPKFLAGGQSLVPMMSLRMARPDLLIDLNGLAELDRVEVVDGTVRIGALCRHRTLELDPTLREAAPLLHQAARLIGHPAIRNRGTLGGSLAHADPAAELPAAALALGAEVVVRGPSGPRVIGAADLFEGFFTTAMAPDELLVDVRVPAASELVTTAFEEHAPRHGDFAVVAIAALIARAPDGSCDRVRLVAAGLGSVPVDLSEAAEPLIGERDLTTFGLREVATRVAAIVDPPSDTHAAAEDRRELAQLLTTRALRSAWDREREQVRAA